MRPLLNQNAATSNDLKQIATASGTAGTAVGVTATRIWAITYYLDNTTTPGTPTLMRLVNARKPVPVAENVADLRFTYDTFDNTGNLLNATGDGGMSLATPISPNQIRTINLAAFDHPQPASPGQDRLSGDGHADFGQRAQHEFQRPLQIAGKECWE